VRALAERLLVNPNTIAKAYAELSREKVIESRQGKGVFVAPPRQMYTQAERNRRVAPLLDALVNEGISLGYPPEELIDLLRRQLAELALPTGGLMNTAVIQVDHLTRYFGDKCAVDQVSFGVPRGSVFALLGRNGSGKTTLVRMLVGMLSPTRGGGTILGDDIRNIQPATRGRIGYIAEGHPLIDWMRVKDLESFQKSFYPDWDGKLFKTIVDHFGLSSTARASTLSRGQRAGVSLALVLSARPELLVMDDPALGLDPVARRTLLESHHSCYPRCRAHHLLHLA